MKRPSCLKDISVPVFLLVIMFALSSWIDIYGVYIEMPIFVNSLPESWALPSQVHLSIEAASVGPLAFVIAVKLCPKRVKEWPLILLIIGIGAAMLLALAFLWDKTVEIGGQERSVGILSICSVLALVDCTSTVVYIPYLARFKTQYITAYYVGEGLGSLIPGLIGLAQGVGSEPECVNSTSPVTLNTNRTTGVHTKVGNITEWTLQPVYAPPLFSVRIFLLCLFGMMILSGVSFLILHLAPFCKKEYNEEATTTTTAIDGNANSLAGSNEMEHLQKEEISGSGDKLCKENRSHSKEAITRSLSTGRYLYLLTLQAYLCMVQYSVMPTIAPYSIIPYGHIAYNLFARLFSVVVPLSAAGYLLHSTTSLMTQSLITLVASGLIAYHVLLASFSPTPPLDGSSVGGILSVSSGLTAMALTQYTIVAIGCVLKESRGRMGLLWFGAATQLGAIVGALAMFVLINIFRVFEEKSPC